MPIVELDTGERLEFPDGMQPQEMKLAIDRFTTQRSQQQLPQKLSTAMQQPIERGPLAGSDLMKARAIQAGQGASFNTIDEIASNLRAAAIAPFSDKTFGQVREESSQNIQNLLGQYQQERPIESTIAGIAGGVVNPINRVAFAAKGAPLAARIAAGAGSGALSAGLYGIGGAEGDIDSRIKQAGDEIQAGALIGAILPAGGALGKSAMNVIKNNPYATLGQVLEPTLGRANPIRLAEKFLSQSIFGFPLRAAERAQYGNISKTFGNLTAGAAEGLEESGKSLARTGQSIANRISAKQQKIYDGQVYPKVIAGKNAPATAKNTVDFIADASKQMTPSQRQWVKTNVIDQINDPEGLTISKIQSVKQVIGSKLGDSEGIPRPVINKIYDTLRQDFYDSVSSATKPKDRAQVLRSLQRGDRITTTFRKEGGVNDILSQLRGATSAEYTGLMKNIIKATQQRTEQSKMLRDLTRLMAPDELLEFRQNFIRNMSDSTTKQFTKMYENMTPKTREVMFGGFKPQIDVLYKNMKSLKEVPLNPSGSAAGIFDVGGIRAGLESGGAGAAAFANLPAALAYSGGVSGISGLLASPGLAGRALSPAIDLYGRLPMGIQRGIPTTIAGQGAQ